MRLDHLLSKEHVAGLLKIRPDRLLRRRMSCGSGCSLVERRLFGASAGNAPSVLPRERSGTSRSRRPARQAHCWVLRDRKTLMDHHPPELPTRLEPSRQAREPWWYRPYLENYTVDASIFVARQATKGTWWMPWHQEPMKDVGACDKPREVGNRALIRGFPNGETQLESCPVTSA